MYQAFTVELNNKPEYQRLMLGSPQTCGMKSGKVHLEAGKSVGKHNTEQREEMLIILSGNGKAVIEGRNFDIAKGQIAYIPPNNEHDIINNGSEPLIYVFCVAPVTA